MKTSDFTDRPSEASPIYRCLMWISAMLLVVLVLTMFLNPPMPGGLSKSPQSATVQMSHALGLALYSYANDNNQIVPEASSSTEIFQKLMDGGYVTDPTIFYIPMLGKVELRDAGQKLKPENVCWDVSAPVAFSATAEGLPVLFMTGYRINYVAGGAATPVIKPFPRFWKDESGLGRWFGLTSYLPSTGIAVFYDNAGCAFRTVNPENTIPNVVPPGFKPGGKTYYQLTPDGVLR